MLQKNRKYFSAGVFLLAPLLLFCAEIPAPVSKYYPVQFEDAAYSPRARTILLVNTLRHELRSYLPAVHAKGITPRKITVLYEKGIPQNIFSMTKNRQGICLVTLPENYEDLLSIPGALSRLTAWFLTASAGMDPSMAERIMDSWYVTGIARKLLRNMSVVRAPFTQYFPSAYVLASLDKYPSLHSLLSQELTGEDSCARLLYEEYSEILVLICLRNQFFRKGLLTFLLDKFHQDPDRKDMELLFRDFASDILTKKEKHLFRIREGEAKDTSNLFEIWFRREAEKLLNWSFLPASALKVERLYQSALYFEAPRKKKKNSPEATRVSPGKKNTQHSKDPQMLRGDLADLLRVYKELENPALPAVKMAFSIGRIVRFASPDLMRKLLSMRSALLAFAKKQDSDSIRLLRQADRDFYAALERHYLLEDFLEKTERKTLPPGVRYYVTNTVLRHKYEDQLPTIRNFDALLRDTQRKIQMP